MIMANLISKRMAEGTRNLSAQKINMEQLRDRRACAESSFVTISAAFGRSPQFEDRCSDAFDWTYHQAETGQPLAGMVRLKADIQARTR